MSMRDQDTHDPDVDPDDTLLGRWRGEPGVGELPDGTLDVEDDGWTPTPEELAELGDDVNDGEGPGHPFRGNQYVLYHGTALKHLESIKSRGLEPNAKINNPVMRTRVNLTKELSIAEHFTQNYTKTSGEPGLLLEIHLPETAPLKLGSPWPGQRWHEGTISPKHIKRYAVVTGGKVGEWKSFKDSITPFDGLGDEWNEQQHPRVPAGQSGGGEFATSTTTHKNEAYWQAKAAEGYAALGSASASGAHAPLTQSQHIANKIAHSKHVAAQVEKPLKGSSAERVALRALMKTTEDPVLRKMIKDRIAESFKKQIEALQNKGDDAKAADLQKKLAKMGGEYGQAPLTPGPKSELPEMSSPASGKLPSGTKFNEFGEVVPVPSNPTHPAFKYDLTPDEYKSVKGYTGSHYKSLNSALRDGYLTDEQYKHVGLIHDALDKMPVFKGTVYRGTSGDYASKYVSGKIVEERGFTSTSRSPNQIFGNNTYYEIQSLNGRDVKSVSQHAHENEVLFKSGTRFRVTSVQGHKVYMQEVARFR